MIELLFLLLPIAAAYGWYMGNRSVKREQEETSNKFSRDYVTGVNLLLSNQADKAVDLFLEMLEKQEAENEIDPGSKFEAELTLGNLYRSRGEVDKALRIHQTLEKNPNYSFDQKLLAKQQLARDFMAMGFYDRAEELYIQLVEEPEFAENALQQLAQIYLKTKEWKKAINVSEKWSKISLIADDIELANFYCEYALSLIEEQPDKAMSLIKHALSVSSHSVRASIFIAEQLIAQQNYQQAAHHLESVLERNIDYIREVLPLIKGCYQQLNQAEKYQAFLINASKNKDAMVDLAIIDFIEQEQGILAAQNETHQRLHQNPSAPLFHRFVHYQIEDAEASKAKDSLILLNQIIEQQMVQTLDYRCMNCGYQSNKLLWNCPSCRRWETIKPINKNHH